MELNEHIKFSWNQKCSSRGSLVDLGFVIFRMVLVIVVILVSRLSNDPDFLVKATLDTLNSQVAFVVELI